MPGELLDGVQWIWCRLSEHHLPRLQPMIFPRSLLDTPDDHQEASTPGSSASLLPHLCDFLHIWGPFYLSPGSSLSLHTCDLAPNKYWRCCQCRWAELFPKPVFMAFKYYLLLRRPLCCIGSLWAHLCTPRMTFERQGCHGWTGSLLFLLTRISFHDAGVKNIF